jgi:hypothetical protein
MRTVAHVARKGDEKSMQDFDREIEGKKSVKKSSLLWEDNI